VRYGRGSNAMGLLQTVLTDGGPLRPLRWLAAFGRHPLRNARMFSVRRWSERTVILLVMQAREATLDVRWTGRRLTTRQVDNPRRLPIADEAARIAAEAIGGEPGGPVLPRAMTAHILGGCAISDDPAKGVIDPYHRVFGHPGLHVADGSAVTANLGVNPSLTITAQAERAGSLWPNRGEPDPRPAPGEPYRRLERRLRHAPHRVRRQGRNRFQRLERRIALLRRRMRREHFPHEEDERIARR
jgi:cholesterol oxidase